MSDRLFSLAQEIAQIRQQSQLGLSEAAAYDDSSHNNRLLALEQSLTVMQPDSQGMSHANAYGYGGMIDGARHRTTNRTGVTADDMFDSSGDSGYGIPDNRRRRRSPASDYGWESEDSMQDNRRRRMPSSDDIQDSRDDIQDSRDDIRRTRDDIRKTRNRDRQNAYDTIQNSRGDRRNGASEEERMQDFRNDEAEPIRPSRSDRRRGNNRRSRDIEI